MSNTPLVRLMCPNLSCQRVLAVPETARGQLVRCKNCGTTIRIPQPTAQKPVVPPPDEEADAA